MDSYYDHFYVSNSDLKRLRKIMDPKFEDPADLQNIFDFGTLFHKLVLEPHKVTDKERARDDYELAKQMATSFLMDPLCRDILYIPDLRREHEYYRNDRFGVNARCKVDFESPKLRLCGELKGLSVGNERQLAEAIDRFDYDQAVAWYLELTGHQKYFFAVPSKIVKKTFKVLVDRDHVYYKRGLIKARNSVKEWLQMFGHVYAN